jgi:predicted ArsR family transcriptional regulator
MTVGEIARRLPVTRPAVSQHLKVLRDAGLVTSRRAGTRRIYGLNAAGVADLRAYVESFWNAALAGFRAAAEGEAAGATQTGRAAQAGRVAQAGRASVARPTPSGSGHKRRKRR